VLKNADPNSDLSDAILETPSIAVIPNASSHLEITLLSFTFDTYPWQILPQQTKTG
jgi:hypothetical protein